MNSPTDTHQQIQKKAIIKTVSIIVVIMTTILVMFINKITTPRYLSDIELKINGLELLKPPYDVKVSNEQSHWILVASNKEEMDVLESFYASLKTSLRKRVVIQQQDGFPDRRDQTIAIVKSGEHYMGDLKPPYDHHKMTLTLASVITHR